MCQNSFLERTTQIERCLEHGMPEKIVKSVICTLKKRIKKASNLKIESIEVLKEIETLSISPLEPQHISKEFFSEAISNKFGKAPSSEVLFANSNCFKIPKMCGRFQQQQKTQNQTEHIADDQKLVTKSENLDVDILSVGTAYTKQIFEYLSWKVNQSKTYRLLTNTTQPAHFIAICVLSTVLLTIWPDIVDSREPVKPISTSTHTKPDTEQFQQKGNNVLAAIAYLGAFATHFGSQIWMTFVSGLSLYFALPRHTFGQCQQILFPKYFSFNAMLSIILLVLFVKCFMLTWTVAITVQFATLVWNFVIELAIRLYLAPPMLRLMHEKYKIEDAVGSRQEVGSIMQGDLTLCPHYIRIHKAFRRLHMIIAIGNMTILSSTCLQLYFLASKIQIDVT